MTSTQPNLSSTTSTGTLRIVEQIEDLAEIFDPQCSSVVLRCPAEHQLSASDRCAMLQHLRAPLNAHVDASGQGSDRFAKALGAIGCSPKPTELLDLWTEVLCELTGARGCGVRLARLDRQMCPNFHFDRVTVRALVTWHGETTDLATTPGYAEQISSDESLRVSGAGGNVFRPGIGDLVLMKGELWPELAHGPAVHRSPAVPEGAQRLMCTWDPMD